MILKLYVAALLAAAGAISVQSAAQVQEMEVLWQRVGVVDQVRFGGPSIFIGDVDKDGCDEVAHLVSVMDPSIQAQILILSGRDGRTLRVHRTPDRTYFYVALSEAGDWDGDGTRDYAAYRYAFGFPYGPQIVEVRSGKDDRLLLEVKGPNNQDLPPLEILGGLDLDGDRKPDLLIFRDTTVLAYDNAGRQLYSVPHRVVAWGGIGDLDRDGCDDFAVNCLTPDDRGGACVLSGKTGKPIVAGYGDPGDGLGFRVGGCGDVNADGVLDFFASSDGSRPFPGIVRVFSGRTGAPLYTWRYPVSNGFGMAVAVGDLDQDSMPDLLVGSGVPIPQTGIAGSFFLVTLRNGEIVAQIPPAGYPSKGTGFGTLTWTGAPHPGNPFPVFMCSEGGYGKVGMWLSYEGRLTMFRSLPAGARSLGQPCRGTLAAEPRIGLRNAGTTGVRLHLSAAPPNECAVLMLGLSSERFGSYLLPLPLDAVGFRGCRLYTSVEVTAARLTGTAGNDCGYAFVDLPWPLAKQPSFQLHGQWVVLGQGPSAPGGLTRALSWPQ